MERQREYLCLENPKQETSSNRECKERQLVEPKLCKFRFKLYLQIFIQTYD